MNIKHLLQHVQSSVGLVRQVIGVFVCVVGSSGGAGGVIEKERKFSESGSDSEWIVLAGR